MSEVTRFQMARALRQSCESDSPPALRLDDWLVNSEVGTALSTAAPEARVDVAREWAGALLREVKTVGQIDLSEATALDALDSWLSCRQNRPKLDDLEDAIQRLLLREVVAGPTDEKLGVDDPLYGAARRLSELLVLGAISGLSSASQRTLIRALLIVGLVERFLLARNSLRTSADILRLLRDRVVLLPKAIFPLPHRAKIIRRPGFADLHVVRQEWNRYVAGEIAHVENVMPGELKERTHKRVHEVEVTETSDRARNVLDERDVQTTSRFELTENTSTDTSLLVHVEAQVDTSGVYGPTQLDTHLGGSIDFSQEESESRAAVQSREIVSRAVSRVEERVREVRTARTLSRTVEVNRHELKNDDEVARVGMYRWVDKIVRLQRFVYPHRYLLEFQVPEPAAYVRWLEVAQAETGFAHPAPAPFTLAGDSAKPDEAPLLPTDISEDTASEQSYLALAARWHTIGVTPPPPAELTVSGYLTVPGGDPTQDKTSQHLWITPLEGSTSGTGAAGGVEGEPLKVPPGYTAADNWSGWLSTADENDLPAPGWNGSKLLSWQALRQELYVTVGDSQNSPADADPLARNQVVGLRSANPLAGAPAIPVQYGAISLPIGGRLSGRRQGVIPISVLARNFGFVSVQAKVECARQSSALLAWQLEVHARLQASYFEMLRAHEEERTARQVDTGIEIAGRSPLENARRVREELKRSTTELMLGERLAGIDAVTRAADGRPHTDLDVVTTSAPLIQFLEQAFEWQNMTYVFYPYFWADAGQWDVLQSITSADPAYAEFLRSGSARVVLPARPGYSRAVEYFLCTGQPWHGLTAPGPDDPNYVSVADEVQAQTGGPDDGRPVGSSWEVRLPTTLVCLDPKSDLPRTNQDATLPAPVDNREGDQK